MKYRTHIWMAFLSAVAIVFSAPQVMAQKNGNEPAETTDASDGETTEDASAATAKKNESGDAKPEKASDGEDEAGNEEEEGEAEAGGEEGEEGESLGFQRSGRMEFDERLVKGQAAKSGAVYLFQRTPRRLPGLVPYRRSYRTRIVEPVLGKRELKPPTYSTEEKNEESEAVEGEPAPKEEEVAETKEEEAGKDKEKNGAKKKSKAKRKGHWKKKYGAKRGKKTGGSQ